MISLQHKHSFGLPASTRHYRQIACESDIATSFKANEMSWLLGEGSNTVFLEDFAGTVVHMQTKGIELKEHSDHFMVDIQAGVNWHDLVVFLLQSGVYGLENLALIPGSVGAAPVQNIGAYGAEFADFCHSVRCYDPLNSQWLPMSRDECQFGYRTSLFKQQANQHLVITSVKLKFPKVWRANTQHGGLEDLKVGVTPQDIFQRVMTIRQQKLPDPKQLGNAGSFFKNPVISFSMAQQIKQDYPTLPIYPVEHNLVKVPAAYLIDQSGLKGQRWGQIATHQQQPLVLVNLGAAIGSELLDAARAIRDAVQQRFKIVLDNEVRLIGAQGEVEL